MPDRNQEPQKEKKPLLLRFFKSLAAFVTKSEYRYLFFTYLILGGVCLAFYLINYDGESLSDLGLSMLKDFAVNSMVFIVTTYMIGTTIEAKKEKEFEQAREKLMEKLDALEDYERFTGSGLVAIYPHKEPELNRVTHAMYVGDVYRMDFLCTGGLSGLRKYQGAILEDKVLNRGLHIRILTLAPDSDYLMDAAMLERHSFVERKEGQGYCSSLVESKQYDNGFFQQLFEGAQKDRAKIVELAEWCQRIAKRLEAGEGSDPGGIELRFYNAMPLLSYQRIDNDIFISHERHAVESQRVEAIHYKRGQEHEPLPAFAQYTQYFEALWNDAQFASESRVAQISPVRLIADLHLLELLYRCSRAMVRVIHASLPKALQGAIRSEHLDAHVVSYLTFVDDMGDSLMLMGTTGALKDGKVENRYAEVDMQRRFKSCERKIVLNDAIRQSELRFELVEGDPARYAVLAVPLYNAEGRVRIVLSVDFNNALLNEAELHRILTDAEVREEILTRVRGFSATIATYLHLSLCQAPDLQCDEEN